MCVWWVAVDVTMRRGQLSSDDSVSLWAVAAGTYSTANIVNVNACSWTEMNELVYSWIVLQTSIK